MQPWKELLFLSLFIVVFQGEPGPKGEKGDQGTSGEPVSTAKRCFSCFELYLAGTGQKSCLFWREKVGQDPSAAGMLLSSEMAAVVLGFIVTVEEAARLREFKHLIYSSGP